MFQKLSIKEKEKVYDLMAELLYQKIKKEKNKEKD